MAEEIQNAIIGSATISKEDHNVLQAWLHLEFRGSGQGFGGFVLYAPEQFKSRHEDRNYAGHFIFRCMEIADVDNWHDMKGKTLRVKREKGSIVAIGHITKEDWFYPAKDFK